MDDVFQSSGLAPRLIVVPEMSFTCNGTITGYTFAGILRNGSQFPVIQIWRQNYSDPGEYYRIGADVVIDDALCEGGFTRVFDGVFRCDLNETAQLEIQPGDVLGLEIAPQSNNTINLSFTRVVKGPTNYVFSEEQFSTSQRLVLCESNSINQDLPQITFKASSKSVSNSLLLKFTDTFINE